MSVALAGRRIAVPETRELDVFAQMLERHGANVVRSSTLTILLQPHESSASGPKRTFGDRGSMSGIG
jgi:uroporphyrinogen-III synthase